MISDNLNQEKFENCQILLKIPENVFFWIGKDFPSEVTIKKIILTKRCFILEKPIPDNWMVKEKSGKWVHQNKGTVYLIDLAPNI